MQLCRGWGAGASVGVGSVWSGCLAGACFHQGRGWGEGAGGGADPGGTPTGVSMLPVRFDGECWGRGRFYRSLFTTAMGDMYACFFACRC